MIQSIMGYSDNPTNDDYIQFSYSEQHWPTSTTDGPPGCALEGQDWKAPAYDGFSVSQIDLVDIAELILTM